MSLTLRELIVHWQRIDVIRPVRLPDSKVVDVCRRILADEIYEPPPAVDLEQLKTVLLQAAVTNDFSSLTRRDWKHSPFALIGNGGLFDDQDLLHLYLEALRPRIRPRILSSLAVTYVQTFQADNTSTALLGNFLVQHGAYFNVIWKKAHINYHIFNREQAIASLANLLVLHTISNAEGMAEIFKSAALPSVLANSSLAFQSLKSALETITTGYTILEDIREVNRIINLTSDPQFGLAFGGSSALTAIMCDALLLPLRGSTSEEMRQTVQTHLLNKLNDPRLAPARWHGVGDVAKEVMLRWLTEQSLELFLDIVDHVAEGDANAKRMWKDRGHFWRSYLNNGNIDKAWVVLGREGVGYAHAISAQYYQNTLQFGMLTASSDVSKHVALILKIDSVTIVDWSHNGKCHLWFNDSPAAPELYAPLYSKAKLEEYSEASFTHFSSGVWMKNVADKIYNKTGVNFIIKGV